MKLKWRVVRRRAGLSRVILVAVSITCVALIAAGIWGWSGVAGRRAVSTADAAAGKHAILDAQHVASKGQPAPASQETPPLASIKGLTPQQVLLDPQKQKYIWDAEHATHLIERRFGVRFRRALQTGAEEALVGFLSDDAVVGLLDWRQGQVTRIATVTSTVRTRDADPTPSTSAGLANWLLQLHGDLLDPCKYSLRVLEIDRAEGDGERWNAHVLVSGQGTTEEGGRKLMQSTHHVQFDWKADGDLDQGSPIRRWRVETVQVRSAPDLLMSEVTRRVQLHRLPVQDNWGLKGRPPQMLRFQMAIEDYDRDGFLDIALSSAGRNFLLRFADGRFIPVTKQVGIHQASRGRHVDISASWIDYDNDGYPDLILGGRFYRNEQGQRFTDVTSRCGLKFEPHHMGCAVADYDLDGWCDLYFLYAHDAASRGKVNKAWIGDEQSGGSNRLWRNQGDGTFVDVTDQAGVEAGKRQSFAATWLYADEDRFPDLYVANDFGANSLFLNRGDGTFEDVSAESNTADFATSMGVASGDLDNDGRPEIYVANMFSKMGRRIVGQVNAMDYPPGVFPRIQGACAGSCLYRLTDEAAGLRYTEFSEPAGVNRVGWAYAPAMVDLNNDGRLDLYATCGFLSVDRGKPDG